MSRGHSSIDRVMGRLFGDERKQNGSSAVGRKGRSGGSSTRRASGRHHSSSRMSRVGAKHGHAVFKLIKKGGTESRSGLRGQLNYILRDDKAARVIDPSGRIGPQEVATDRQLNSLTLEWSQDWWNGTRNGQTSHMILSYPRGTSIEDVTEITKSVCTEMFESGDTRFKYIAAIHDDVDSHPHAHIVVNRRADNNKLFQMRSGTEHSYEGFREAMAAHAERRGIHLDPTSRFERGILERQPSYQEQRAAQKEGRAPVQRERTGQDLQFAKEQVTFSRIGYEAMAVIAANADCPRLERAYADMANFIETYAGDYKMPALSEEENARFDEYSAVLNESIRRTETMLESKDPAARVPAESRMSEIMANFTQLNPTASYARALHQPAQSNSIYQHKPGENAAELRGPEAQATIQRVADEYGLDAEAVTSRLENPATSQYLEQRWLMDDARRLAERDGMNYNNPADMATIREELTNAHQIMREELVASGVLRTVPHLDDDYRYEPERPDTYSYVADRQAVDVRDIIEHYREGGASDQWIAENHAPIANDVFERHNAEHQQFLHENAEAANLMRTAIGRNDEGQMVIADRGAAEQIEAYIQDRNLASEDRATMLNAIGADFTERYPTMPHHVADDMSRHYADLYATMQDERERPTEFEVDASFDRWAERSGDNYELAADAHDHQEIVRLVQENTTDAQYERFRNGDLNAIEHITTDPVFARQLVSEVANHERANGTDFDRDSEQAIKDHQQYLNEHFGLDRDREHER